MPLKTGSSLWKFHLPFFLARNGYARDYIINNWQVAKHNNVRLASMVFCDSRRVKPVKPGKAMYETAQQACETHETG